MLYTFIKLLSSTVHLYTTSYHTVVQSVCKNSQTTVSEIIFSVSWNSTSTCMLLLRASTLMAYLMALKLVDFILWLYVYIYRVMKLPCKRRQTINYYRQLASKKLRLSKVRSGALEWRTSAGTKIWYPQCAQYSVFLILSIGLLELFIIFHFTVMQYMSLPSITL